MQLELPFEAPLPAGWTADRWDRVAAMADAAYRRDYEPLLATDTRAARAHLVQLIMEHRRLPASLDPLPAIRSRVAPGWESGAGRRVRHHPLSPRLPSPPIRGCPSTTLPIGRGLGAG